MNFFKRPFAALLLAILLISGTAFAITAGGGVTNPAGISGDTGSTDNRILRADGTGGKTLQNSGVLISDNSDITAYDATNDGNPEYRLGAADAEELHIQSVFDTGAQTLDFALFTTDAASATADKGEYRFNVDGTLVATIDDGGIELADSFAYFVDTSNVLSETTLGTTVVSSSLTSVATLTALTVNGVVTYTPSGDTSLLAGTTITVTNGIMRIVGNGGAVTLTNTPTIADASDGTTITIQGTSDTNTVKLQDEAQLADTGLQLSGGQDFTLGIGDTITLFYDSGDDNWYEKSRSDN